MATIQPISGSGYGNVFVDSLIWGGGKWTGGPITYYFASGAYPTDPSDPFGPANNPIGRAWSATEKAAFETALQLYENVANIEFQEVGAYGDANLAWWLLDNKGIDRSLGRHQVPDGDFNVPLDGAFNYSHGSWSNLAQGGFGFVTIIHELGHGLGLAHPHDGGDQADATTFPGVRLFRYWQKGDFGLNQGIWTTMTYNDGWDQVPPSYPNYGYQGTPMAFDIAALQELYGANTTYHTGADLYTLPGKNGTGTFWSCIWDAGGLDEISGEALSAACKINLNDATLEVGDPNAGGFVSWGSGIRGGFTIANGVVIENATGGKGNDTLTGNEVANELGGAAGADSLIGGLAGDTLDGGAGSDKMLGGAGDDLYWVDATGDAAIEPFSEGKDTVKSFATYTLGAEVEILELQGALAINGTGNTIDNLIIGNTAANTLDGKAGVDTMQGGGGGDTYLVDDEDDKADETGGDGIDTVKSAAGSYTLGLDVENLTLTGAAITGLGNLLANIIIGTTAGNTLSGFAGDDSLNGGDGDDSLAGGDDNDTIDGGAGADTYSGGAGNDRYKVDASDSFAGADAGTDTVEAC
jgi:serralysin